MELGSLAAVIIARRQLPSAAELPNGRHLARPLLERTRRCATHSSVGGNVVLYMRHTGYLRAAADFHMVDHTRMCTHDDEVTKLRRARDAALGHNHAMSADDNVVGDLDEIIDLRALADDCVRQRSSIDR